MKFSPVYSTDLLRIENSNNLRWLNLCNEYLPIKSDNSFWRFNREANQDEPTQGWKLHISATIIDACELFEKVAPYLNSKNVQFKAPNSLDELTKINEGLSYGYWQIGKFITIYPKNDKQAVHLATELHQLTKNYYPISIPFDEQFANDSSVYYRYGAFKTIEINDENGQKVLAIKNNEGKLVPDDRCQTAPNWASNPFKINNQVVEKSFKNTPLGTTYRIFSAITQRGKGGTYQAFNFSEMPPQLCVVKEGRKNGELGWNGQDGYLLVKNEYEVLSQINRIYKKTPKVFTFFEVHGNFYFVMEYVEGRSLHEIMKPRVRRFSISWILKISLKISTIIKDIHQLGWVWNDCKPANLILNNENELRPIDFEGAFKINGKEPFDWKSKGFSNTWLTTNHSDGKINDIYSFGAVVFFLLTGEIYDHQKIKKINSLRKNVPLKLVDLVEGLLTGKYNEIAETIGVIESLLIEYRTLKN